MSREVMQMAMTALQENWRTDQGDLAIEALRTALAKPEPEPVAWMYDWTTSDGEFIQDWTTSEAETLRDTKPNIISNIRPLYTAQREWVGLTDEEIEELDCVEPKYIGFGEYVTEGEYDFARAIEAKLREKNNYLNSLVESLPQGR